MSEDKPNPFVRQGIDKKLKKPKQPPLYNKPKVVANTKDGYFDKGKKNENNS